MAKELVFGDGRFTFPTQKAAKERIQAILYDYPTRSPLVDDALELVTAIVAAHPSAADKIGPGVASIDVRATNHGNRGFWITRTDGSVIDFSYLKALCGEHSHKTRVCGALRFAVRDQIDGFRRGWFATMATRGETPLCELTGQRLWFGPQAHVDHIAPLFVELAERFISAVGSWETVATRPVPSGIGQMLADEHLATAWQAFHEATAVLRVVHASANLARAGR